MSGAKEKKKIGLTTQIFIALIMGAILGIVLHVAASDVEFVQNVLINGVFYVIGQGFIRLMQMLVVPLVFCSLICGATAIGDSKTLGKVGIKIIGFYILTTMMAVAVALGIGLLIRPGIGLDMSQVQQVETGIEGGQSVSFAETILNIIPKNPIGALANGEMLQVIVFALIIGIILAKLQDKTQLVTNFFQQGNDIMMLVDTDMKVIFVNELFTKEFGKTHRKIKPEALSGFMPEVAELPKLKNHSKEDFSSTLLLRTRSA